MWASSFQGFGGHGLPAHELQHLAMGANSAMAPPNNSGMPVDTTSFSTSAAQQQPQQATGTPAQPSGPSPGQNPAQFQGNPQQQEDGGTDSPPPPGGYPDRATIDKKLSSSQALLMGMQSGALFGALGGLPIWAIEQTLGKKNFLSATAEKIPVGFIQKVGESLWKSKKLNFAGSMATTTTLFASLGAFLAWEMVGGTRKKLDRIDDAVQQQHNGTFNPKPPNLFTRALVALHIKPDPILDPRQSYQEVERTDLDSNHAFMQGMATTTIIKLGVPLLTTAGLLGAIRLHCGREKFQELLKLRWFKDFVSTMKQPLFICKMTLTPLIGGLIAWQLAPWMKKKVTQAQQQPTPTVANANS